MFSLKSYIGQLIFIWLFLIFPISVFAQRPSGRNEIILPVQYIQFPYCYPLVNPAAAMGQHKYELKLARKQNASRFFSQNYVHNLSARIKFQLPDKKYHSLGINVIGDHDGSILRRNRFSLAYSYHTPLTHKLTLGTGLGLGLMGYSIVTDNNNPGLASSTSMSADGNAGVWLYTKDAHLGLSVNQFPKGTVAPFEQKFLLMRHFNIVAGKEYFVNPDLTFRANSLILVVPKYWTTFDLYISALISNTLIAGLNYQHQRGLSGAIGVEKVRLQDHKFDLLFSGQIMVPRQRLRAFIFEVNIAYYFEDKNKGLAFNSRKNKY